MATLKSLSAFADLSVYSGSFPSRALCLGNGMAISTLNGIVGKLELVTGGNAAQKNRAFKINILFFSVHFGAYPSFRTLFTSSSLKILLIRKHITPAYSSLA
jgi:hypothetical protein